MAGNKYLQLGSAGVPQEVVSAQTSAGGADANKIVALDSTGKIDSTLLPSGLGADSISATAGEAISAGDLIYIDATGAIRKADGSAIAKMAIGYATSAIANGVAGTVFFEGSISGKTGLTIGAKYFLSDSTPGAVALIGGLTATPGNIVQLIGVAISTTSISFEAGEPIIRA